MQKTRLGISVGLMGFITYFGCCFGGYIAAILLFGYILLVENNQWLRKTAVKAMILTIAFRSVYKELHADHETGAADNKTG